jgi:hypothetical protein
MRVRKLIARQPVAVARMTYDFAEVGMPVMVVAKS